MQINRLFEIVYLLLDQPSITAKTFAEHFEVSVRTIYRDIDTLASAGIPIYTSQGKGGGISLLEDYVLNKSVLSESEQNEILFALQSLAITRSPERSPVLSKLGSLFNKDYADWIEVDLSHWGSSEDQQGDFDRLREAILKRQIITFDYLGGSGEKSRRKAEPLKLVFKVNAWYLQAYCLTRHASRTFKLTRMANVQTTEDHFEPRSEIVAASQQPDAQTWIAVQLRISAEGAYRVYDEFGETSVTKNPDGSFDVAAVLPDNPWLLGYLLSFGADLEVLAPPAIRDKVQAQAEKILSKYNP